MMKILFFIGLISLPLISHSAESPPSALEENSDLFSPFPPGFMTPPDQTEGWNALPSGRPFPSLPSDPRDLKIALRKNSKNELEADIGGYRSVAGWKGKIYEQNTVMHIGIEGNGYFVMSREGSRFPLLSSDGLLGLYAEAIRGLWLFQTRYTHVSAHLSDGLYGTRQFIKYSRETLSVRVARQFDFVRAYMGYHFLTNTTPKMPRLSAQFGMYAIFPWHLSNIHPFAGADYRWRSREEGSALNLMGGLALVSSLGAPPLRLTYSYLKGHDLRGQFYGERTSKWSLGLDLDF